MAKLINLGLAACIVNIIREGELGQVEVPGKKGSIEGDFALVPTPMMKARIESGEFEYDGEFEKAPEPKKGDVPQNTGQAPGQLDGNGGPSWLRQGKQESEGAGGDKFNPDDATVDELKKFLTEKGIQFSPSSKKEDLVTLAKTADA